MISFLAVLVLSLATLILGTYVADCFERASAPCATTVPDAVRQPANE